MDGITRDGMLLNGTKLERSKLVLARELGFPKRIASEDGLIEVWPTPPAPKARTTDEGSMDGWKEGRMQGRKDGRKEGRKEGRMEGRKEGWKERWKEGRKEGKRPLPLPLVG